MNVGQQIKKLREEKGMTLEELGNKVGVGKSTVRKWETGMIANMRRDKIEKVAQALDVSPAYFFNCESFQSDSKDFILSDDEKKLILQYRKISSEDKEMLNRILAYSSKLSSPKKDLVSKTQQEKERK